MKIFLILFVGFIILTVPTLIAQSPEESLNDSSSYIIEAYRLLPNEKFTLDGKLDEPFWTNITPITNFRQQVPQEGGTPTELTEIYIAYDSSNLYIAAILYDSDPAGILAYQKRRNQGLGTDDRFMWILDTFNDGRNAYFFETNPTALRGDGLLTVGQGVNINKSWDGIWDVRTTITDYGWVVEIQIPLRSLDFNPDISSWGINFQRTIRRKSEEIVWSGWRRNQGLFRPQNAGTLIGLTELSQGVGLEVTPYLTTSGNRTWDPQNQGSTDSGNVDAGFDISYSITPSIRSSLTVNTDFAETEVDQRRVNLTRFPLFFPEQRSFFLEGATIFNFAPRSGVTPFFSRNIGLQSGEPIPVNGGFRLLGREGNTNMGFYQIRTGNTASIDSEDFTVARISQNLFTESNIGLIYTRRATLNNDLLNNRHTLGVDMELGTSTFMGTKNVQFQSYFVWHNLSTPEDESSFGDRSSYGFRVNYPNFPFNASMSYRVFGTDFSPALGFTPRNSFRRLQPTVGYEMFFENSPILRSWEIEARYEHLTNLDFEPETINFRLTPVDIQFESGDRFETSVAREFEQLFSDFDILRDGRAVIPAGKYNFWSYNAEFNSASFRRLSAGISVTHEGFWTGKRTVLGLSSTLRPYPGINLSVDWNRSDVSLPELDFTTNLFRLRGNIDLTPNTALTNILQFDDVSEVLGLFNRFRWTLTPGSDLFLVFSYNWIQIDSRFEPIEAQSALKINYTHRF